MSDQIQDCKYLSDGRKVVIVGKLNQQEAIVQEIFVTESGDEIPSGERFVAKSLHDAPVQSYKAKEEARLLKRIESGKKELAGIVVKQRAAKQKLETLRSILKCTTKLVEAFPDADLDLLSMVMTGTAEWVVECRNGLTVPKPFLEAVDGDGSSWGDRPTKLISLLGMSGGDITYSIGQYSDWSGGTWAVHFFRTWDEAVAKVREFAVKRCEQDKFSLADLAVCRKLDIELPRELLVKVRERLEAAHMKAIHNRINRRIQEDQDFEAKSAEIRGIAP